MGSRKVRKFSNSSGSGVNEKQRGYRLYSSAEVGAQEGQEKRSVHLLSQIQVNVVIATLPPKLR